MHHKSTTARVGEKKTSIALPFKILWTGSRQVHSHKADSKRKVYGHGYHIYTHHRSELGITQQFDQRTTHFWRGDKMKKKGF